MQTVIQEKIKEIEQKEKVKILHCVESGSRAWGFASPDSDYDVRFIYVRPKEFYLRLDKTRDVIEWQLDDTLDINGWDIQKALRLLHKSNPTLFEWNASPIVYKTTKEWTKISEITKNYFSKKQGLYHYLLTAKSNYKAVADGDSVKLKKYFYVLRPVLACKWILTEQTPPPVLFSELTEKYLDSGIKPEVDKLLKIKTETSEIGKGKRVDALNDYLENNIKQIEKAIEEMPAEKPKDWEKLNQIFYRLIL